ncbi:hypothetical protein AWENTII_007418 [Aspergillus wentii]|nr:hypothetical protein MW887_011372 [Aspergillus wentii]
MEFHAFGPQGNGIELDGSDEEDPEAVYYPTITDVYATGLDERSPSKTKPYWIQPLGGYVFLGSNVGDNLCDYVEEGRVVVAYTARGVEEITRIQGDDSVTIPAFPDGLLLCPRLMNKEVAPMHSLGDIPYIDIHDNVYLSDILPESSYLFHEVTHLVTTWRLYGGREEKVTDFAYDVLECIQLAAGAREKVRRYYATLNAQSFVYFAMSYWYYLQEWHGRDPITFYAGRAVSSDWMGDSVSDSGSGAKSE